MFKKNLAAKFTFEHACTVKTFLSDLAGNNYLKDRIVTHFRPNWNLFWQTQNVNLPPS